MRGYQKLTEAAPDKFLRYQYIDLLDKSRERISKVVNAPVDECVFVTNATTGINTVLRNLVYKEKDVIIYFDTIYGAIDRTLKSIKETNPQITLRKVGHGQDFAYTLPCTHPDILNAFSQTISRILYDGYTPRVAVFDTIVSKPGVRFPFERLTKMCKEYGILSMIDGAHAVGQIPLNLSQLDADFFVTNCHKWLYTPRGCALLHVPKRNQHLLRTSYPTSYGYEPADGEKMKNNDLAESSKTGFVKLFEFVGTADNSPFYCVPAALNFRQNLCPGGEEGIYNYIRHVAQRGADLLAMELGTEVMDEIDEGRGLKTMGSFEASDRRDSVVGYTGGLRDCAMANVLLPMHIEGAASVGSIAHGPGGAGSAGGLSPLHGQGRKSSYGFPSAKMYSGASSHGASASLGGGVLSPPSAPWMSSEMSSSPKGSPAGSPMGSPSLSSTGGGAVVVKPEDVKKHLDWMMKTLVDEFRTYVTLFEYNGKIWTRVCGQIYLELRDFEWLGSVLKALCERVRMGESLKDEDDNRVGRQHSRVDSTLDLEALGRTVSEVRLGPPLNSTPVPPVPPVPGAANGAPYATRRFDGALGQWVEA
jgi:hercynylcysteine S-oxide lyase